MQETNNNAMPPQGSPCSCANGTLTKLKGTHYFFARQQPLHRGVIVTAGPNWLQRQGPIRRTTANDGDEKESTIKKKKKKQNPTEMNIITCHNAYRAVGILERCLLPTSHSETRPATTSCRAECVLELCHATALLERNDEFGTSPELIARLLHTVWCTK